MIAFTVHGTPAPAGSKKGFYNPKARRVIITDDSARSRPWKAQVADAAAQAMACPPGHDGGTGYYLPPLTGPLRLTVTFYFPRPKSHYGTGRNAGVVKAGAPPCHTVKPDATKLLRALEDALTGIVYRDDAQIVEQHVVKAYADTARAEVTVTSVPTPEPAAQAA